MKKIIKGFIFSVLLIFSVIGGGNLSVSASSSETVATHSGSGSGSFTFNQVSPATSKISLGVGDIIGGPSVLDTQGGGSGSGSGIFGN